MYIWSFLTVLAVHSARFCCTQKNSFNVVIENSVVRFSWYFRRIPEEILFIDLSINTFVYWSLCSVLKSLISYTLLWLQNDSFEGHKPLTRSGSTSSTNSSVIDGISRGVIPAGTALVERLQAQLRQKDGEIEMLQVSCFTANFFLSFFSFLYDPFYWLLILQFKMLWKRRRSRGRPRRTWLR